MPLKLKEDPKRTTIPRFASLRELQTRELTQRLDYAQQSTLEWLRKVLFLCPSDVCDVGRL
jgi:hypothetical protein